MTAETRHDVEPALVTPPLRAAGPPIPSLGGWRHGSARTSLPAVLLAAPLAVLLAALSLACSSGGPVTPVTLQPTGDTWISATATLLDTGPECLPGVVCDPEIFDCLDRERGYLAGHVFSFVATHGIAGTTNAQTETNVNLAVRGLDAVAQKGLSLVISLPNVANPTAAYVPTSALTFLNVAETCDRLNAAGQLESRFNLVANPMNFVRIDSIELDGNGQLVHAAMRPDGSFSPRGIVAGSFRFLAQASQVTPTGSLDAQAIVEGCFRVNLPAAEQGVPITPIAGGTCP